MDHQVLVKPARLNFIVLHFFVCNFLDSILAASKQLFGPERFKERVLELNASDERGIEVVRTKVKTFAQAAVGAKQPHETHPIPPFKIIILDEADSMTQEAQAALRRTMETYSRVTRFCIICNYVSRIIDPITSRCAKFRFKSLDNNVIKDRLEYICSQEQVTCPPDALQKLMQVSEGDLRRAITILQSCVRMYGKKISLNHVLEISGVIPTNELEPFFKILSTHSIHLLRQQVTKLVQDGFGAAQILNQLHDFILVQSKEEGVQLPMDEVQKSKIMLKLAQAEKCLLDGADEYLQLLDVGSYIQVVLSS